MISYISVSGHVVLSVTCLNADTCLTADPEVANLILAGSYTLVEIDHEIILKAILLQEGLFSVKSKIMYTRCYTQRPIGVLLTSVWVGMLSTDRIPGD